LLSDPKKEMRKHSASYSGQITLWEK